MEPRHRSVVVVGGGIAGIEAARKLAELHQSPLLVVPSEEALGGKALRQGVLALRFLMEENRLLREKNPLERYRELRQRLVNFWNFWRQSIKEELLRLGVEIVYGRAVFTSPFLFSVDGVSYETERVIVATGSQWEVPDTAGDSFEMWTEWENLPSSLLVFGEGREACEVAYLFASLGSEVSLVTSTGVILQGKGERFRQVGENLLRSSGVKIIEGCTLSKIERDGSLWKASLQDSWGNEITLSGEKVCFLSRRRSTLPFSLEKDVTTGKVQVNERYEAKVKGVFAIGDIIHPGCEAQVAKREGILVAENVFLDMVPPLVSSVQLHKDRIDYRLVPEVLFLDYPLARVGMTVEEAKMRFQPYEIQLVEREWPFLEGQEKQRKVIVSVLLHKVKQHILGAVVYGPCAESLVNLFSLAMAQGVRFHEIGEVMYIAGTMEDFVGRFALEI